MIMNMNNRVSRIISVIKSIGKSSFRLKKILKLIKYDYVYTATPLNTVEAYLAMRHPQEQLVVSEHASAYAFNSIYTKMKKIIYPKVYCISVLNQMDTIIYLGWNANAIYVPHLVTYKAKDCNELSSKIILNIGRLTKDKQQGLLIDMWAKVQEKNGWKLWIVGDGEEKDNLEKKIIALDLKDSVKLIPATKNIEEIYKRASFFAFTSRCEGFGMVLLEAMSFGVPCISFDCPSGPRDIVSNEVNGYLIENNNTQDYILKLQKIVQMEKVELDRLGNGAFNTVLNWDNKSILRKWDKIFKRGN